jgi:hypothetical protein
VTFELRFAAVCRLWRRRVGIWGNRRTCQYQMIKTRQDLSAVVREILFHNYSRCAPRLGYSNTYNNRSNLTRLRSGLSPAGTRGNYVCLNWIQNLKLLHVVPTELQRGNHCGDIKSKSELICLAKYCMLIIARKHFLLSINAFLTHSAVSNCSRTMSNLHSRYNSSHWSS